MKEFFSINAMWKLMAVAFWVPGLILSVSGSYFEVEKLFMFGMMWLVGASPFWGFMIFIDLVSRIER